MKRRASTTVVFFGTSRLLRVDLAANGEPLATGRLEHTTGVPRTLVEAVRTAIAHEHPPAPRVVVVAETLWTQTVDLARAALQGLSPEETARALAFEVEPLSGIAAPSAALASVLVGTPDGEREMAWVTVLEAAERAAIEDALRERGAKLVGIVHPAGLVVGESSARVEVWDRATWCSDAGPPRRTRVLPARPGQRSWETGFAEWIGSVKAGSIEWTGHSQPSAVAGGVEGRFVAGGDGPYADDWPRWLAEVARSVSQPAARVPLVGPAPRPRQTIGAGALCAVLSVLTLGLVVWQQRNREVHAADCEGRASIAEQVQSTAKQSEATMASLSKQADVLRARIAAANGKTEAIEREWSTQSKRLLTLATELGQHKPAGVTLLGIEPDENGGLAVRGISLDSGVIQAFAADLGPQLAAAGWAPRPASAIEKRARDGRAYFEFTIGVDQPSAAGSVSRSKSSAATQAPVARKRSD